jgi:hypothetical protein
MFCISVHSCLSDLGVVFIGYKIHWTSQLINTINNSSSRITRSTINSDKHYWSDFLHLWDNWRKKLEYNLTVHQLFIDFKKAYDSVRREVVLYNVLIRGVGCMDVGETLLPYRNATNIFLQISKKISYFKILINLRTYITYNENIASFNVLHKSFIRILVYISYFHAGYWLMKRVWKRNL